MKLNCNGCCQTKKSLSALNVHTCLVHCWRILMLPTKNPSQPGWVDFYACSRYLIYKFLRIHALQHTRQLSEPIKHLTETKMRQSLLGFRCSTHQSPHVSHLITCTAALLARRSSRFWSIKCGIWASWNCNALIHTFKPGCGRWGSSSNLKTNILTS